MAFPRRRLLLTVYGFGLKIPLNVKLSSGGLNTDSYACAFDASVVLQTAARGRISAWLELVRTMDGTRLRWGWFLQSIAAFLFCWNNGIRDSVSCAKAATRTTTVRILTKRTEESRKERTFTSGGSWENMGTWNTWAGGYVVENLRL
jgi:hypothetical protein